jgi:MinD superfamily P-loop ATPase
MDRSQPGPVIDEERCTACGCCVDACLSGVLKHEEKSVSAAQPEQCGGCGECELVCPEDAVEVPFCIVWGDGCAPDPDGK